MRFADRRDVLNSAGLELDRLGIAADRLVGTRVERPPRAGALRGLRGHRRRGDLPARDARPGGRLRRDLLRVLRGRRPRLARPGSRLAGALRARGPSSTTTTPPPPSTALRPSSTSWGATACARWPRTPPPGCCCCNGPWMVAYDTAYVVFTSVAGRTLAPLRGRLRGPARVAQLPPPRARRTAAPCGCPSRSASGARCSATRATPSIRPRSSKLREQPARNAHRRRAARLRHGAADDAHGARPRLVPGLPRSRAHRRGDARPVRARSGHLHLPRRPRAAAAAPRLGDRARVAPGRAARRAPARPRPGPLALAAALHAALLRAPRPVRLRAGAQLVARLRRRRAHARRTRCTSATATRPMRYVWMPDAEQNRVRRRQGRGAAGACAAGCAAGTGRPRGGPTSTWPTRPRWPSGSGTSTSATPWWCPRRWPSATSRATSRATRAASSGSTGWSPTSARSRWPRPSASSPTCA